MYFFVNTALNEKNSGIEHAQMARMKMFEYKSWDYRLVTTYFNALEPYWMERFGFNSSKDLNLYRYYGGFLDGVSPRNFRPSDISLGFGDLSLVTKDNCYEYYSNGVIVGRVFWFKEVKNRKQVSEVDVFDFYGNLYRADYYNVEGYLARRDYYNPDNILYAQEFIGVKGQTYLTMSFDGGQMVGIRLIDRHGQEHFLDNVPQLTHQFFSDINDEFFDITRPNIFIMDRYDNNEFAAFDLNKPAQVLAHIHNSHSSDANQPISSVLNNNYEYVLHNGNKFDGFIVATKQQAMDMAQRFNDLQSPIFRVPVGINAKQKVVDFKTRKPYSVLVTARVAHEKGIDKIVRAIGIARQYVPEITLDVYGYVDHSNDDWAMKDIRQAMQDYKLGDEVIRFHGYTNKIDQVQSQYQVYALASEMEGFNISLMQALNNGCVAVAFDVNYGPGELVVHNQNGYLINNTETLDDKIQQMADYFVFLFTHEDKLAEMSQKAYALSSRYDTEHVANLFADMNNVVVQNFAKKTEHVFKPNHAGLFERGH